MRYLAGYLVGVLAAGAAAWLLYRRLVVVELGAELGEPEQNGAGDDGPPQSPPAPRARSRFAPPELEIDEG